MPWVPPRCCRRPRTSRKTRRSNSSADAKPRSQPPMPERKAASAQPSLAQISEATHTACRGDGTRSTASEMGNVGGHGCKRGALKQ